MDTQVNNEKKGESLDVKDFLKDSLYYPAAGFDTAPIEVFKNDIKKFVYADCSYIDDQFSEMTESPFGDSQYRMTSKQQIDIDTILNSSNNKIDYKSFLSEEEYKKYSDNKPFICRPFAYLMTFETVEAEQESIKEFSVLFICGDSVITFGDLYINNEIKPKALVLTKMDCSGRCWTGLFDEEGPLGRLVGLCHPHPSILLMRTQYSSNPDKRTEYWTRFFKKTPIRIYAEKENELIKINGVESIAEEPAFYYMVRIRR